MFRICVIDVSGNVAAYDKSFENKEDAQRWLNSFRMGVAEAEKNIGKTKVDAWIEEVQ